MNCKTLLIIPHTKKNKKQFLAWLFFKEKKSRYCHHSGAVVSDTVLVAIVVVIV